MTDSGLPLTRVVEALRAADLLRGVRGDAAIRVTGVSQDSRSVEPGDLFLAWKGSVADAHDFVSAAEQGGASAAVVERSVEGVGLTQLVVSDGRAAAALAADRFVASPWRELFVTGVTGTNGKTTTALLTRHLLGSRSPAAALGTLGLVEADGTVRRGTEGLTTPGPVQLSSWLRELADGGANSVTLEASSHALEQRRLDGVRFDVVVFTNLSQDHLDYHPDLESYFQAKARLLELLEPGGVVVVNGDDPAWARLPDAPGRRLTFGLDEGAELRASGVELHASGARLTLESGDQSASLELPLIGGYNVENALAAAGVGLAAGFSVQEVAEVLEGAPQIAGRLEKVVDRPFAVLIDFAHTPAALSRVLDALRPLVSGRLICVFGAGGDRDRGKRPHMGRQVSLRADLTVITSDNPRTEDPEAIIDDIVDGVEGQAWERVVDREDAIARALDLAEEGDLVLLAGKGHETHQVVGTEKRPFDERVVVRRLLESGRAA